MKTQVLQLDPHDDYTSVRDKISWARCARILLVYPLRTRRLKSQLDLRLLQRYAQVLGSKIAIVSASSALHRLARELNIPVFRTSASAERRTWPSLDDSERFVHHSPAPDLRLMQFEALPLEGPWRDLTWVRLGLFSLAVLSVLALVLLIFPSASVTLTPKTRMQSLLFSASVGPEGGALEMTGLIPVHQATYVMELNQTTQVTGSIMVPDTTASGLVRFTNLTTGPVVIPSGTILRTTAIPPVRFATANPVTVPLGVGKTMDVQVRAVKPGSSGNLPIGSLVVFESDLGTSLTVTNPGQMLGGSDRFAPIQTTEDRTRLESNLIATILSQCEINLPEALAPSDVYFPDTLAAGKILSETFFPAEDQTGQTLSLTINMQCQAGYASASDVQAFASQGLNAHLPVGFEPASSDISTFLSDVPVTSSTGITRWQFEAQRLLRPHLDDGTVKHLVQGRSPASADQRLLASLQLANAPAIQVKPAWWPWLPFATFRISISIHG